MASIQLPAGQVEVTSIGLSSSSGVDVNIIDHIIEIELDEDIEKHFIAGRVRMNEYLNLIEALPIIGEEVLSINYKVAGEPDSEREMLFRVTHINDYSKPKSKQHTYDLTFISTEYFTNNQLSVDIASTKKVEDMISDMLKRYTNTNKSFSAESTAAIQHITFPGTSVKDSIDYCVFRAQSEKYPDSLYKFYETASGFKFKSLGDMAAQPQKITIEYFLQNLPVDSKTDTATFSATNYKILTKNDTARSMVNGGYRNNLLSFDPLIKKYKDTELDYFADEITKIDPKRSSSDFFKGTVAMQGSIDFALVGNLRASPRPKSTKVDKHPENYHKFFLNRQMSRVRLNDLVVEITVPMTNFIEAGDIINFNVPNDSGVGESGAPDLYVSGKYLVTSLRNIFNLERGVTILTCKKSGFQNNIQRKD